MVILDENATFGEWAESWGNKKTIGKKYYILSKYQKFPESLAADL